MFDLYRHMLEFFRHEKTPAGGACPRQNAAASACANLLFPAEFQFKPGEAG
jgi:hypothetical protein